MDRCHAARSHFPGCPPTERRPPSARQHSSAQHQMNWVSPRERGTSRERGSTRLLASLEHTEHHEWGSGVEFRVQWVKILHAAADVP
eukprot:365099-Chlamydomonas_euryale.AAC.1